MALSISELLPRLGSTKQDILDAWAKIHQMADKSLISSQIKDVGQLEDLKKIQEQTQKFYDLFQSAIQKIEEYDFNHADEDIISYLRQLRHDLKTPLSAIKGYGEMLAEDLEEDNSQELLSFVSGAIQESKEILSLIERAFTPVENLVQKKKNDKNETLENVSSHGHKDETKGDAYTILIVDDNKDNRALLSRYVEREGYSAFQAASAKEAFKILEHQKIDIIFLDVIMPEMDGYEALQVLKADKKNNLIPVIMISALDDYKTLIDCIENGAEDYLFRPFDPVLLRARMNSSLEKKKLREIERQYLELEIKQIMHLVVDGILILTRQGVIQNINTAAERIFRYKDDEICQKNIAQLIPAPEFISTNFDILRLLGESSAEHSVVYRESMGVRQDNSLFPLEFAFRIIENNYENMFAFTVRDITERKKWERELQEHMAVLDAKVAERTRDLQSSNENLHETLRKLESAQNQIIVSEKMASLGTLTAGIAHELKNPLNFIINFSEISGDLLKDFQNTMNQFVLVIPKQYRDEVSDIITDLNDNLGRIREHGRRADDIIHSMLMHARTTDSKRSNANLQKLVEECLNLAYHGFRAQNNGFNVSFQKDYDPKIQNFYFNQQNIGRVLLNLFNNAFYALYKKSQDGKEFDPSISIKLKLEDNQLVIFIKDNGVGMPKDVMNKIFMPFFTTKPAGQGTGLGLSLSYDIIVSEHLGSIDVDSQEGEYTEFKITLPYLRESEEDSVEDKA